MVFDTVASALLGGSLIGIASLALLVLNGRIAGVSGIVAGLLGRVSGEFFWKMAFVGGLLAGGLLLRLVHPVALSSTLDRSYPVLLIAGLLVGFGARLGSGCTSGHGVCGISRLSRRSLVATLTFTTAGVVMATIVSRLFGGVL